MFTVLHREWNGAEHIRPAVEIDLLAAGAPNLLDDRPFWYIRPDGATEQITDGTVFVMNESGKTVAKYTLGDQRYYNDSMLPNRYTERPQDKDEKQSG